MKFMPEGYVIAAAFVASMEAEKARKAQEAKSTSSLGKAPASSAPTAASSSAGASSSAAVSSSAGASSNLGVKVEGSIDSGVKVDNKGRYILPCIVCKKDVKVDRTLFTMSDASIDDLNSQTDKTEIMSHAYYCTSCDFKRAADFKLKFRECTICNHYYFVSDLELDIPENQVKCTYCCACVKCDAWNYLNPCKRNDRVCMDSAKASGSGAGGSKAPAASGSKAPAASGSKAPAASGSKASAASGSKAPAASDGHVYFASVAASAADIAKTAAAQAAKDALKTIEIANRIAKRTADMKQDTKASGSGASGGGASSSLNKRKAEDQMLSNEKKARVEPAAAGGMGGMFAYSVSDVPMGGQGTHCMQTNSSDSIF